MKQKLTEWDYALAVALLTLSVIILWVLLMHGNAWGWICAYWAVSASRNLLGMYGKAHEHDGEEDEDPYDETPEDDDFWAVKRDPEADWEGWNAPEPRSLFRVASDRPERRGTAE